MGQNRNLFKLHKQNIHTCAFLPRRSLVAFDEIANYVFKETFEAKINA